MPERIVSGYSAFSFILGIMPQPWDDEAVEKIKDGTITNHVYDPKTARLQRR